MRRPRQMGGETPGPLELNFACQFLSPPDRFTDFGPCAGGRGGPRFASRPRRRSAVVILPFRTDSQSVQREIIGAEVTPGRGFCTISE